MHGDGVSQMCLHRRRKHRCCRLCRSDHGTCTQRQPYQQLLARTDDWSDAGVRSVRTAGDADAPSTIAAAGCSGHKLARQFDRAIDDPALAIRREVTELSADYP